MNSGEEALINLFKTKQGRLMKKLQNGWLRKSIRPVALRAVRTPIYGLETCAH
jgi:hypothetical protein